MVFNCERICFRCSINCERWGKMCSDMTYKYFFIMLLLTICYCSGLAFMILYLMKYFEMNNILAIVICCVLIFGSGMCCFCINSSSAFSEQENGLRSEEDELDNV